MRPTMITLSLAALALGSVLAAAPAFAQSAARPPNDGGTVTTPNNGQSGQGGDYYQPQAGPQSTTGLQMNAQGSQGAMNDCAARFRSYNPQTGTYMGRDGRPHRCP
jgi:hypothetical protein